MAYSKPSYGFALLNSARGLEKFWCELEVISMLLDPNLNSPANIDAAVHLKNDPEGWKKKARSTKTGKMYEIVTLLQIPETMSNFKCTKIKTPLTGAPVDAKERGRLKPLSTIRIAHLSFWPFAWVIFSNEVSSMSACLSKLEQWHFSEVNSLLEFAWQRGLMNLLPCREGVTFWGVQFGGSPIPVKVFKRTYIANIPR